MSSGNRLVVLILGAGLIGAVCFGGAYFLFAQGRPIPSLAGIKIETTGVRVNSLAPSFEIPSITGGNVKLEDYIGQPVVLNFWATWCGPCVIEMPLLEKRFTRYSPDLTILGINIGEPIQTVRKFINDKKYTFPILWDNKNKAQDLFLIDAYPTSLFIDKEGIIRAIHVGLMSAEQLDRNLQSIGVGE